jgi:hypothetical protein
MQVLLSLGQAPALLAVNCVVGTELAGAFVHGRVAYDLDLIQVADTQSDSPAVV